MYDILMELKKQKKIGVMDVIIKTIIKKKNDEKKIY